MRTFRALPCLLCLILLTGSVHATDATVASESLMLPEVVVTTPAPAPVATSPVVSPVLAHARPDRVPVAMAAKAPSAAGSLLQVLFGLLVVVGLLGATLWIMKRMGSARLGAGTVIKIIGGVAVGNRERVLVLEVADQWLVIGVATGQVSTLATLPRQDAPESNAAPAPNFSAWLKQTIEKRNGQ